MEMTQKNTKDLVKTTSTEGATGEVDLPAAMTTAVEEDRNLPLRVYSRRYVVLALFVLYSMANAFQWIEYAIITNIVVDYYNTTPLAVNWTSLIYMFTYIPLVFPASWLQQHKGLRFTVLIGSIGTTLGSWVKIGSLAPDKFYVSMIGQTIAACSQIFILGVPPMLAAVWFGPHEVSRACGVGVFGNQLGVALGFVIPPLLVPNTGNKSEVGHGLSILFYSAAIFNSVILLAIIFLFKDHPPTPPSRARAALQDEEATPYIHSMRNLLKNKNYIWLFFTYGMNVGVFYAVSTLLNQTLLPYFPKREEEVGWMGLTIVIAGMAGSLVCGTILDKTKKFKETVLVVYLLTFLSLGAYMGGVHLKSLWVMFLLAALLGFFMTGYLPLGFEFAAELTYPEPETTTSGLLNASAQFFGIVATMGCSYLLENFGDLASNACMLIIIGIGTVITGFIKADLKRTMAHKLHSTDEFEKFPQV